MTTISVRVAPMKPNSQKAILLRTYESGVPMIDEDAMLASGVNPRSCWWKRCSELREEGLIERAVHEGMPCLEKRSTLGEWCQSSWITDAGHAMLATLKDGATR